MFSNFLLQNFLAKFSKVIEVFEFKFMLCFLYYKKFDSVFVLKIISWKVTYHMSEKTIQKYDNIFFYNISSYFIKKTPFYTKKTNKKSPEK